MTFVLRSTAFASGFPIPFVHVKAGGNQSPPLQWEGAPITTKSFALLVEDPDAPFGTFTHWALFNIPANCDHLLQGVTSAGVQCGTNDFGDEHYDGPQPPEGHGIHRYFFRLCALDVDTLELPIRPDYTLIKNTVRGHVLAETTLVGTYETKPERRDGENEPKGIEFPATPGLTRSGTFSQVVVARGSRFVYTSGQVAVNEEGNLIGGKDLAAQTQQAMSNVDMALKAAGASFADVVKTTTFVVGYKT